MDINLNGYEERQSLNANGVLIIYRSDEQLPWANKRAKMYEDSGKTVEMWHEVKWREMLARQRQAKPARVAV